MPGMHLRQSEFTYSVCGTLTKNKLIIQKLKEAGDSRYIYQNELDTICFQYDMVYGDFKYLTRKTASDKNCMINHYILLKILNMMNINMDLLQWFINFWVKRLQAVLLKRKICLIDN